MIFDMQAPLGGAMVLRGHTWILLWYFAFDWKIEKIGDKHLMGVMGLYGWRLLHLHLLCLCLCLRALYLL